MDLFELFEIEKPEMNEKVTPQKKQSKKKEKEKVNLYNLPLQILAGGIGKYTITSQDLNKIQATEEDIKTYFSTKIKSFSINNTILTNDKPLCISLKSTGISKGNISVNENSKYIYGNIEIDISNVLAEHPNTLDITDLVSCFKDNFPLLCTDTTSYAILQDGNIITIYLNGNAIDQMPMPEEDIKIYLLSGEILVISKEQAIEVIKQHDLEKAKESYLTIPTKYLSDIVGDIYCKNLKFISAKEKDTYLAIHHASEPKKENKKDTLYKIDGITLSLLFKNYLLNKDDFNGKEEVNEESIISFLVNKGHKEFAFGQTRLQRSEKHKMILVSLEGSRKGIDIHPCFSVEEQWCEKSNQFKCLFKWKAQKIPAAIWKEGYLYSRFTYELFHSEILMDLYYLPTEKTYHWFIPEQYINSYSTITKFDSFLQSYHLCGLIKVGQFHSHADYTAYFSSVDDQDEVQPGVYGVWGDCSKLNSSFVMRCVYNNQFIPIEVSDVFDFINTNEIIKQSFSEQLIKTRWNYWVKRLKDDSLNCDESISGQVAYINNLKCIILDNKQVAEFYRLCSNIFIYHICFTNNEIYLVDSITDDEYKYSLITSIELDETIKNKCSMYISNEKADIFELISVLD